MVTREKSIRVSLLVHSLKIAAGVHLGNDRDDGPIAVRKRSSPHLCKIADINPLEELYVGASRTNA